MKKLFCVMLVLVMSVSLMACGTKKENDSGVSGADNPELTDNIEADDSTETEGTTDSNDTLIVGTEAGFAPYEYVEGNDIVGIDMDIAQAIADAMGKELEISNMDFDGALLAVQQGKVDLVLAAVSIQEDRAKVMDFSDTYVDSTDVIVVNKDNPMVASIDDLNDKIIGVQLGNIADFWVSNEENITAKEVKRYAKFSQASEALKNGKIDCIVMDLYPAQELVAANESLVILEGTLFEDKYAVAVKKGNTELLDKVNEVIAGLIADGKIDEFTLKHTTK